MLFEGRPRLGPPARGAGTLEADDTDAEGDATVPGAWLHGDVVTFSPEALFVSEPTIRLLFLGGPSASTFPLAAVPSSHRRLRDAGMVPSVGSSRLSAEGVVTLPPPLIRPLLLRGILKFFRAGPLIQLR